MTTVTAPASAGPTWLDAVRAERQKLFSVRSTWWTLAAIVVLGAGLTTIICAASADWLASDDADEAVGSFITWGMMIAQVGAVVLGALAVTTEYGSGQIRSTFAATPARGRVLAAKALVVTVVLFVAGTVTALLGYVGGNWFLDREGIGMALEGDVLRSMYGSGLYLAGLGLMSVGAGFILRHTAGVISLLLALVFVLSAMAPLIPGVVGEWIEKLMPGNAGASIATPVAFNPGLLDPWPGYGAFVVEIAVVLAVAWILVKRRDA
ncbi:ABC transporter permease subunit [Aeromicrobium senzhongii]|uniref:ABC transporter permease subunit n=1 Tax=Aeromicrobium senzhongii TaxID=2663859 RepID=A0ABX6ST40_9ACTN|nr:ABC transporter permease subunit [Aeromicrobium senzhongii]MTB89678.1 ABC transporter permease subunit [Aeromicrobium senzhongii]QNL94196.1 ABC transporter permease subunit [Aeromicrobium senzhongii]